MTVRVHPTAIVDPGAELAEDVVVEAFAVVGPNVTIGHGSTVGPRVVLEGTTTIGHGCSIGAGSIVGGAPQDLKYSGEATTVQIGNETCIREYTTVNRGTAASGSTIIVNRCYLMTYVHVAHDCRIEDGVVLANSVQLAGHVFIGEFAQLGGLTPVHQFVRIGRRAFVGGGSRVPRDIPPYALTAGNPMRLYGINVEGLRRAGVSSHIRLELKRAFRLLFNASHSRERALDLIRQEAGGAEVEHLVDFVEASTRGVLV